MPDLPTPDDLWDLSPDDVLAAVRQYIQNNQVVATDWDLFEGRPSTEQVPCLELTDVPVGQMDPDDDDYQLHTLLLLLVPEDETTDEFADNLKGRMVAGRCSVQALGNGRFVVLADGREEMALLMRGRGVWWRAEDYLDYRLGFELRDADGPPFSMRIVGDVHRPLPGSSPESQLDLICEGIETRGGPTDQTRVLVDVTPWSISGANISLSAGLIARLAQNRVSVSFKVVPFAGRRKALQAGHDGDELVIPLPREEMFYETLRRDAHWRRDRGPAPSWVPGCWMWLVETDLGWFCIDGDEEPRAMGLGGPLF